MARYHAGQRCLIKEVEQRAGVVPVWMRQPDPAHIAGVHDGAESVHETSAGQAEASVDDHGLGSVQDKGVHGQEAQTGYW
jgi:hypothetical protein